MGERNRIGITYFYTTWIGGKSYIQNLIHSLDLLDDAKKPLIDLYCQNYEAFVEVADNTDYPYLNMCIVRPLNMFKIIVRKILSYISQKASYRINMFRIISEDLVMFPYYWGSEVSKLVHWIPDLQEKHLPEFFSKKELKARDKTIREVCNKGVPIVFSSYDSQNDFYNFYPEFINHPTFVVHFAVFQPSFSSIDISVLKEKYHIRKNYFLCVNQFWKHKNHLFLFKAFKKAVDSGLDMQLVCTGRLSDDRNPVYMNEIKDFIISQNLIENILILGVIEKLDLLALMKYSNAVIQPSLFEGWNTTVEDCKAMSKFVFLSDLKVHREQINENVCFFDPKNESDLVNKLLTVSPQEKEMDYKIYQKGFCDAFYSIIKTKIK